MITVSLDRFPPLAAAGGQYPIEYVERNRVVKLEETDDTVTIGVVDADEGLLDRLRAFHRKETVFHRVDPREFAAFVSGRLADTGEDGAGEPASLPASLDDPAVDAPTVNLVNAVLMDAIRLGASDVHIEVFAGELQVRVRVDGVLAVRRRLPADRVGPVAARIKVMADLDVVERRLPQDGRLTVRFGTETVDFRVSTVPVAEGESIVLRMFHGSRIGFALEDLGMEPEMRADLERLLGTPHGLILVCGPTGSGKTTTLNAALRAIRHDGIKVISIEDPVEYVVPGVTQIQTNEQIGVTFESLLRRVVRQDPDVIMVGEIRDSATARLSVRAALTGHLVLASLHTNDAPGAIGRLIDMGIAPYLLAAVLRGCIAQRLVRRVCVHCRHVRSADAADELLIDPPVNGGSGSPSAQRGRKEIQVADARGCEACQETGYRGRIGLFELLALDADGDGARLISAGADDGRLRAWATGYGYRPLLADGGAKAMTGTTTVAELRRVLGV